MKYYSKHCQPERVSWMEFSIDCDDNGIPIGICDKIAKHSIVAKESDHIVILAAFCFVSVC
jgi:hypothetical protein